MKFFWPYLQDKNPFYKRHEYTPLHFAAYHGLVDVTQFMVSILGVDSIWGDCMAFPADQGSEHLLISEK